MLRQEGQANGFLRMERFSAQFEHWAPYPLDRVFCFFANPENLPRIMPHWMDVRLENLKIVPPAGHPTFAGTGSDLKASFRAAPYLPFRIRSVARITGFELNRYFEDIQGEGPFKSWHHRHEFEAEVRDGVSGTLVRDRVQYEIGFGPLGKLANLLFIAPQMRRTFAYRQRVLAKLL